MWTLTGLDRKLCAVGVKIVTMKRERLGLAIRRLHVVDEFERRRFAQIVIQSKRPEIVGIDPGHETQLHSPAQHLVDDGDLLGQAKRMIERDDVAHRSDADAPRTRARAHGIETGRGHPALVGAKMMLDAEGMVEAEFVAQFKLIPELFVALMRRHSGLAPDR